MEDLSDEKKEILRGLVQSEESKIKQLPESPESLRMLANLIEIREDLNEVQEISDSVHIKLTDCVPKVKSKAWKKHYKKRGRPRKIKPKSAGKMQKAGKKTGRGRSWPKEVEDFVLKAKKTMKVAEMAEEITKRFSMQMDGPRLNKWMYTRGIKPEVHGRARIQVKSEKVPKESGQGQEGKPWAELQTGKRRKYTPEVIKHIKKIVKTMNITEMVENLNGKYGFDLNENRLAVLMSNKGIKLKIWKKHTPKNPKAGPGRGNWGKQKPIDPELIDRKNQAVKFIQANSGMKNDKLKGMIKDKFGIGMDSGFIDSVKQIKTEKAELSLKEEEETQGMDKQSADATEEFFGDEDIDSGNLE